METINIRLDGPGALTPTKRLKAALLWARQFIGTDPNINRVELRRDTPHQVLVMRFEGSTRWDHLRQLCMVADVQSITFHGSSATPRLWGLHHDCDPAEPSSWGTKAGCPSEPFRYIGDPEVRPALRESPGSVP